jgi:hypothetical protein
MPHRAIHAPSDEVYFFLDGHVDRIIATSPVGLIRSWTQRVILWKVVAALIALIGAGVVDWKRIWSQIDKTTVRGEQLVRKEILAVAAIALAYSDAICPHASPHLVRIR